MLSRDNVLYGNISARHWQTASSDRTSNENTTAISDYRLQLRLQRRLGDWFQHAVNAIIWDYMVQAYCCLFTQNWATASAWFLHPKSSVTLSPTQLPTLSLSLADCTKYASMYNYAERFVSFSKTDIDIQLHRKIAPCLLCMDTEQLKYLCGN